MALTIDFTVNWNSAVFTCARPVNIQFRTENNKCLSFSQEGKLSVAACDLQSYDESFFYDSHNRYIDVNDTSYCLDAADLKQLHKCSLALSQKWKWVGNKLVESYTNRYLSLNNNTLILSSSPDDENTNLITRYQQLWT